ncbi:MAG TPA: phosphoserine phosphatase SerB [Parvularcula sp.]|nr:phosphoserine phosphatase SerB [Parvularcula sp.]HBS30144.1 phosphoserine phosphatase SerB [Parvularcula sp.]
MAVTAITLVCNPAEAVLDEDLRDAAADALLDAFGEVRRRTLSEDVAEDFLIDAAADRRAVMAALAPALGAAPLDVIAQPAKTRAKKLLIADMDSTIIGQECIDELADFAGLKTEIAAITERAMRGELDFEAALAERVAMLKGLPEKTLEECYRTRIALNPGARTLVQTMNARGAATVLVSGGFAFFVQRVAQLAGFQHCRANELLIAGGKLTGAVRRPILGREAKEAALRQYAKDHGIPLAATLAVGDGANDLDMIRSAGLGLAWRAKPKVAAAADAEINHADLTALLYAQGLTAAEFA